MFANFRVVSFSPAGRSRNMALLHRYLASQRGIIDSHEWWVNTPHQDDQDAIRELVRRTPGFYSAVEIEMPYAEFGHRVVLERLRRFYIARCQEPQTIYLKIDDDFCYLGRDALHDLLEFRVAHPDYFLVCPPTVNSVLQTHVLQRTGLLPREPFVYGYSPFDFNGFGSGPAAQSLHEAFLDAISGSTLAPWQFPRWEFNQFERATIGAACFFGRDFAAFGGDVTNDDEHWMMCVRPRELNRISAVSPCLPGRDAFFAHYAYSPQKQHLDGTDILSRYENVALWRRL